MSETHFVRGRIVTADRDIPDGVVGYTGTEILDVSPLITWVHRHPGLAPPPADGIILPGLVDIHNHGGGGHSFTTTSELAARAAARHHHAHGSTTVLAGIVTSSPAQLLAQTTALGGLAADEIGGIYCEGPFLSAARCGAQDPRYLLDPDPALAEQLVAAAAGAFRVLTVAPERPGVAGLTEILAAADATLALGHSDADYDTFTAALAPAGPARLVTHLANGMPGLHHRAAGPVAAALVAAARGDAVVELIADGVHVDQGFVQLVFAAAPDRVALITDAMAAAGMPDGSYDLGPQRVTVADAVARLPGGALAGGTSHLLENVARVVRYGIPLRTAVRAATRTPAAAVGLTRHGIGELRPGAMSDLIVVDDDLRLKRVLRRGVWL
jgi:N-acetylglucosamine-6-phosphate deacetylase